MRILFLNSDWKWTGPAAPMLLLAGALRARGHEISLACAAPPPEARGSLLAEARAEGLAPVLVLRGGRGIVGRGHARDFAALRHLLAEGPAPDLIHTWHSRDHALALRLSRAAGKRGGATPRVIRSLPDARVRSGAPWNRWLLGPATDGLLCVGETSLQSHLRVRAGRATAGTLGAVDAERFAPGDGSAIREELGLSKQEVVIGIVARAQRHRRFDLLFDAFARLLVRRPEARLLLLGRGTHYREVVEAPVRRLDLGDAFVGAGYRADDYIDALRAMDLFTLLVPGSDGSCRALQEAMACGLPAVTTRRGALPELVEHERSGLLVDETPDALAAAWEQLIVDRELRGRLGAAARWRARERFATARFAAEVEALYEAALSRPAAPDAPAPSSTPSPSAPSSTAATTESGPSESGDISSR